MVTAPPYPKALLDSLLAAHARGTVVTLDDFAEACAPFGLASDQIDALLRALEAENRRVEANPIALTGELGQALRSARAFVAEHGRKPSIDELAAYSNTSRDVVMRALLFGRIMSRG